MSTKFKFAAGISLMGYVIGLLTTGFLPGPVSLFIPTLFSLGCILTMNRQSSGATSLPPTMPVNPEPSNIDNNNVTETVDPLWGPLIEYIHVIEDMIISEGHNDTLDNEIVEKVLSLLSRINRLIPQLKELNDGSINHNIQRLIFKDLNGAINPFLKLSGEAKRINRRLLLDGIKDINSKLSNYVETIEKKDLIELQTRMDLIQRRYRSTD